MIENPAQDSSASGISPNDGVTVRGASASGRSLPIRAPGTRRLRSRRTFTGAVPLMLRLLAQP
jgi:hypothetical protein